MRRQGTDAVLHNRQEACKISNRTLDGLYSFWYAPDILNAERGMFHSLKNKGCKGKVS